jgi:hypothetical protein
MKITRMISQHRRAFTAEYTCEGCGNKNCQNGVINGINPKICKKCNPKTLIMKTAEKSIEISFNPFEIQMLKNGLLYEKVISSQIAFAKFHVESALKKASKKAKITGIAYGNDEAISDYEVDKDSILNAYNLKLII